MKFHQILFVFCVLCVLVIAVKTDDHKVHNYLQEKSHQNKHHRNEKSHNLDLYRNTETRTHSNSYFKHLAYRNGNQHCQVICNGSSSNASDIQIFYNGDAGLIAYLKQSAYIAVIQDYASNITVILNGQAGTAIVENIGKDKYYSLEKNTHTEEVLWISSKSDFSAFFKKLTSLKPFVKVAEEYGKSINKGEDLAKAKTPYLKLLDIKSSDSNFIVSIDFMTQLNSTLRFIFKGQGTFTIHKNVLWFANVNLAFSDLFPDCHQQLQSLDLKLNLSRIYGVDSGVEALVNLLTQIGTRVNLATILRNQLNSPDKLLELLAKLSGGSEEGIDGIVTVITTVIKATNGHASVNDVITAILNYKPDGGSTSLAKVVDEALDLIESQNRAFNNTEALQWITKILKAINNNNLVYRNINISDILTLLVSRNPVVMIETVIRIFIRFTSSEGFPQTIRDCIQGLNNTNGFNIIARIFPGANLDTIRHFIASLLSNIPIIGNIFRNSSNIDGLFNTSSHIVSSIPIIGPIIVNSSSGIVSGIEHAIHSFVDPIFGSGSPTSGNGIPNISPNETETSKSPSSSGHTNPPNSENRTKDTSSPNKGTTADTSISNKDSQPPNPTGHSGSTKEAPVARKRKIYELPGNKDRHHTHLHASNRKENMHESHRLQEKEHQGHLKSFNRRENLHQNHGFQEKDNHYGHLRGLNKNENHYRHQLHEKDAQGKKHHKEIYDKKFEDHHNHH